MKTNITKVLVTKHILSITDAYFLAKKFFPAVFACSNHIMYFSKKENFQKMQKHYLNLTLWMVIYDICTYENHIRRIL